MNIIKLEKELFPHFNPVNNIYKTSSYYIYTFCVSVCVHFFLIFITQTIKRRNVISLKHSDTHLPREIDTLKQFIWLMWHSSPYSGTFIWRCFNAYRNILYHPKHLNICRRIPITLKVCIHKHKFRNLTQF